MVYTINAYIRIANNGLGLILFFFAFILFYFYLFWDLNKRCDVTSHMTVTVIQSCDTKKNIEGSRINNIIQHNNNILIL